jgi:hypothetical protein
VRSSKIFEWGRLRSREQCGFKIPLSETAIAEAAEAWSSGAPGAPEAAEAAGVAWAVEAVEAAEAAEAAEGGRGRRGAAAGRQRRWSKARAGPHGATTHNVTTSSILSYNRCAPTTPHRM